MHDLRSSLRRLTAGLLIAFLIVAISLVYWSAFEAPNLYARADNPRLVEAERAIRRGAILDRYGNVLAQSVESGRSTSGQSVLRRIYPHPEAASVIGYYSLRYGVGGVEAAFDDVLRGKRDMLNEIVHHPQIGGDVRLTLDLKLQEATAFAFGRNAGAVVVVEVPTGEVRALYSSPSLSPGSLDATYDLLRLNPFAPLLNRVTQGVYQPGGALQTIILAAMLADQAPLTMTFENADQPLVINNLTLDCAIQMPVVTLLDSYAAGCPAPFVGAAMANARRVQDMITAFGLLEAPTLVKFGTVTGKSPTPLNAINNNVRLQAAAAGQGDLIVTPLQMALIAATIANDGNTITPFMVDAIRPAGSVAWQPQERSAEQNAVITQETAAHIRQAMRSAVTAGAGQAANVPDIEVYGHASIAYTGLTANSWFIGFRLLPGGRAVVVAVVIEGRKDVTIPARIGGIVLRAAAP